MRITRWNMTGPTLGEIMLQIFAPLDYTLELRRELLDSNGNTCGSVVIEND